MTANELMEKSIYIIEEYYQNHLQPFFDHASEDILWFGPGEKQELRGREAVISTFSSEVHELTFTMGSIRSVCISTSPFTYEVILQYEIYTHYPDGDTDFHNQRLHYSWFENKIPTKDGFYSRWEIALVDISNTWRYDDRDVIYPIHYERVNQDAYDRCDYFAYLDVAKNHYDIICGQAGTGFQNYASLNYAQDMKNYVNLFVAEEDQKRVLQEMDLKRVMEQVEQYGIHSIEYGSRDTNGNYMRKRQDYRFHDQNKKILLMSRSDITESYFEEEKKRRDLEQALTRAQTDSLTKLLNAQTISEKINECLTDESQLFALYFIDLDDFKGINDNYGHPAGDCVLQNIANALRTVQASAELIGRVGGDEFVYFAAVSDEQDTAKIGQHICDVIHSVKISEHAKRQVTGSVGIALSWKDGRDYDTLVHRADQSLYEAKKSGKNQYSF